MDNSRDNMVARIEAARTKLNTSIEAGAPYDEVYQNSVELDQLIELYIVSGF